MRIFLLYFLFILFFENTDSFFFNKIKNSRFFYNNHLKELSNRRKTFLRKPKYIIHHNKYNIKLEYNNITDYYYDNKFLIDKNIINIYPAGLRGFYEMGICVYIKEKYNIDNYIFSGASAGAWNSLLMAYKGSAVDFKNFIFDMNFENIKSIFELQLSFKKKLLLNFKSDDFDLKKMYIGVTTLDKFKFKNFIFTDFESLEDAIDCIIASSNIPFITGKLIYKYRNKISFDGGFLRDPYIHNPNSTLVIHPDIFKDFKNLNDQLNFIDNEVFDLDFNSFLNLFKKGYNDAVKYDSYIKKNILNIT